MKKKTTLELLKQTEKVSLYSISFSADRTTEFERFIHRFEKEATMNKDYQKIIYALSLVLKKGALERFFRPEGQMRDNLVALPIESCKIRLYCLRITDEILIVGNGGYKLSSEYESSPLLYGYALDLQKFDALLRTDIENGFVTIEERQLIGTEDVEYYI